MVLMLCPVTVFAEEPAGTLKGDVNCDGQVTTHDAALLQNCLEGLQNLPEEGRAAADFNGDGVVNYSDLTELQRYLKLPVSDITVEDGKATAGGTEISKAALHTRVTLTANSPSDGMEFDKWIVNEGGVTLADASSATTTFTMPVAPVSVTATYKPLSAGETGGLAITVEGFEVGKTPNDITYSFASTIPGVTFSKDDVTTLEWFMIDANGRANEHPATSVFEADTTYSMLIYFKAKGLTSAPTVTVNGKTATWAGIDDYVENEHFLVVQHRFDKLTPITIDGPDAVCKEQNYEFSVTASDGVTLYGDFGYNAGENSEQLPLNQQGDGSANGVVEKQKYVADSFKLTVTGKMKDGTLITSTKTVQISQDHIYVNGVCGCGAVQHYTVTYDPGEFGTGSIAAGDKTHGKNFTLSDVTFTRQGYVQIGWSETDGGPKDYKLGGTYSTDADVTLYPVWDEIVTVTAAFTTTVKLGGNTAPGKTIFTLETVGSAPV